MHWIVRLVVYAVDKMLGMLILEALGQSRMELYRFLRESLFNYLLLLPHTALCISMFQIVFKNVVYIFHKHVTPYYCNSLHV